MQASEEPYRELFERLPIGLYRTTPDGKVLAVNPTLAQMLGYPDPETALARNAVDGYFNPEDRQRFLSLMAQDGIVSNFEARWRRYDGTPLWMRENARAVYDAAGRLLYFEGSAEDITERKRAEEALKESEERYRSLFNGVPIGLYRTRPDGRVLAVNPALVQMLDYPSAEALLAREASCVYAHPEGRRQFLNLIERDGRVSQFETQWRRYDGTLIWVRESARTVYDEHGQVLYYEGSAEDITDRKQAEEALQQRNAELQTRNEELDAFAHTVAHDLQNPSSAVLGFADFLLDQYPSLSSQEIDEILRTIAVSARKMNNIIEELLLLVGLRKQEVEMAPVDMAFVVSEALVRVARFAEERHAEVIVPDVWPAALGYGPWIEEVWINYISNAIKYGGAPPRVELGATAQPDGMVRFWVRDNGNGLATEQQAKLLGVTQLTPK